MKLYSAKGAPNPDRVTFFLKEKGKLDEVEIIELALLEGEHRSSDYKSVNELARVPSLKLDDGTVIGESRAICTYLESVFPEPNLMGTDPKEKALIEMWDRRIELMLFIQFATWFRNAHPMMAPLENPQVPEAAAKAEKSARAMAKRVDAHLAENDFLACGRFSIADITLYCFTGFAGVMKWKPHEEFENIGKWMPRVMEKIG